MLFEFIQRSRSLAITNSIATDEPNVSKVIDRELVFAQKCIQQISQRKHATNILSQRRGIEIIILES